MKKNRELQATTGQGPTRRRFLQRAVGTSLATAAGVALLPDLAAGTPGGSPPAPPGPPPPPTPPMGTPGGPPPGTTPGQPVAQAGGQTIPRATGSDVPIVLSLYSQEMVAAAFYGVNRNKAYLASAAPTGPCPSTIPLLNRLIDEITAHGFEHLDLLSVALGITADGVYPNLDAPTLPQFLDRAQALEDENVSRFLGAVSQIQDKTLQALMAGMMAVKARHAGGLRAYRKVASPAEGGDPNTTLTQDGEAVNRALPVP